MSDGTSRRRAAVDTPTLSRRLLLGGALGLVASACGGSAVKSVVPAGDTQADVAGLVRSLRGVLARAPAAIGERRLADTGVATPDLDKVAARLPDLGDDPARALRRAIEEDFLAGRVVEVDGWRLSETEVAAAVLLAVAS